MALDSRDKRASAILWGLRGAPAPQADGQLNQADRQHLAAAYRGILARSLEAADARASMLGLGLPFGFPAPRPDSAVGRADRQHVAASYRGIAAAPVSARASMLGLGLPLGFPLPRVNGGLDQADRQQLANSYSGIAAANAANQAPTDIALSPSSVAENAVAGTVVGTATATDPDDPGETFTWTLLDDAGGRFAINASSGVVTVAAGPALDPVNGHDITIRVTDQGGLSYQEVVPITVIASGVNQAPTDIVLSSTVVGENPSAGTFVATATATDPDDPGETFTWSLLDDAGGRFAINASSGVVTVAVGAPSLNAGTSHNITVKVTDQGALSYQEGFAITVADVTLLPSDSQATIDTKISNASVNDLIGIATGTYRQKKLPLDGVKNGQRYLGLGAEPEDTLWTGALLIGENDWTTSGSNYTFTAPAPLDPDAGTGLNLTPGGPPNGSQYVDNITENGTLFAAAGPREELFRTVSPSTKPARCYQVVNLSDLSGNLPTWAEPNAILFHRSGNTITIRQADVNLSTDVLELSTTDEFCRAGAYNLGGTFTFREDITFENFKVCQYANPIRRGTFYFPRCTNIAWKKMVINDNHAFGISWGVGTLIQECELRGNGQGGLTSILPDITTVNAIIEKNAIVENRWHPGVIAGWESGGSKISSVRNTTYRYNLVLRNETNGIWQDGDSRDTHIHDNIVSDNDAFGVHDEITNRAQVVDDGSIIEDNALRGNARRESRRFRNIPGDIGINMSSYSIARRNLIISGDPGNPGGLRAGALEGVQNSQFRDSEIWFVTTPTGNSNRFGTLEESGNVITGETMTGLAFHIPSGNANETYAVVKPTTAKTLAAAISAGDFSGTVTEHANITADADSAWNTEVARLTALGVPDPDDYPAVV